MAKRTQNVRQRLARERDRLIRHLRNIGLTPALDDDGGPRGNAHRAPLDEGDLAQASERQELGVLTRARIAERINVLTEALRRFAEGTWGACEACGERIEAARLEAMPEAATCLRCQEERERNVA